MKKITKWFGIAGIVLIFSVSVTIVVAMVFNSILKVSATDSFITAFGGAFFAYVMVKFGELFTRLSVREKLNQDTLVEVQYVLNDHLNRIYKNTQIAKSLVQVVGLKSPVVNFMKVKAIPMDKISLRNMKNLRFINEMFNYYVDIEVINEGLELLLSFAIKMVDENSQMRASGVAPLQIEAIYKANSDALSEMVQETIKLLEAADKDCISLIAKSNYLQRHRNNWLSLAYSGGMKADYGKDFEKELPDLIQEVENSIAENVDTHIKKSVKDIKKANK